MFGLLGPWTTLGPGDMIQDLIRPYGGIPIACDTKNNTINQYITFKDLPVFVQTDFISILLATAWTLYFSTLTLELVLYQVVLSLKLLFALLARPLRPPAPLLLVENRGKRQAALLDV